MNILKKKQYNSHLYFQSPGRHSRVSVPMKKSGLFFSTLTTIHQYKRRVTQAPPKLVTRKSKPDAGGAMGALPRFHFFLQGLLSRVQSIKQCQMALGETHFHPGNRQVSSRLHKHSYVVGKTSWHTQTPSKCVANYCQLGIA